MQHQRHAHGLEAATGEFRPRSGGRWRQLPAGDVRERHATAFEQLSFLDDAAVSATAQTAARFAFALPRIALETVAVQPFQFGNDAVLQPGQVGFDGGRIHVACLDAACIDAACIDAVGIDVISAHDGAPSGHGPDEVDDSVLLDAPLDAGANA